MHLTIHVLGVELLSVAIGPSGDVDEDEHEHLDDVTGTHTGFVRPPAVPAELDMPDRTHWS
ncbi:MULTISPECIES: hypothetical protein [unclassified Aeromicrobium]|uniref:hypothetical protein n=1 Tax=unclassified Aeromicrobium TaxID=2633570 RepID=UPI00288B13B0|nr:MULTISPECIES: hypothetical protein [unclassified Aeromicrobium]